MHVFPGPVQRGDHEIQGYPTLPTAAPVPRTITPVVGLDGEGAVEQDTSKFGALPCMQACLCVPSTCAGMAA
jgi:hypothetical protein